MLRDIKNINKTFSILSSPIEYLKGVGPLKADLLKKELGIFTFEDLLNHYPLRYIDRTKIEKIGSITPQTDYAQVIGKITGIEILGQRQTKRMIAWLEDETGILELTWVLPRAMFSCLQEYGMSVQVAIYYSPDMLFAAVV